MSPEELLAHAGPLVNDLGWKFYFTPETLAVGAEHGLDAVEWYFLGRGGVMGDVEWQVVDSAFGYFNPSVVEAMWTKGRARLDPREAGRLYLRACQDFGRSRLASVEGLAGFCAAAEAVLAASDTTACPLYAGLAAEDLAEDLPARAMQLVTTMREDRGGKHLVAVVASGLRPVSAHYLRRPEAMGMFGWPEGLSPEAGATEQGQLASADQVTATLLLPAFSVLDDAGRDDLSSGLDRMAGALA